MGRERHERQEDGGRGEVYNDARGVVLENVSTESNIQYMPDDATRMRKR